MDQLFVEIQNAAKVIATPNCAAWMSAIAALGAVAVAVIVAIKQNEIAQKQNEITIKQAEISEQQNKIALFEKKYEVYCEFQKIINIRTHISDSGEINRKSLLHTIEMIYGFQPQPINQHNFTEIFAQLFIQFKISEYKIAQTIFLFSGIEKAEIYDLLSAHLRLIRFLTVKDSADTSVEDFAEMCDSFEEKYMDMMRKQLNLI